MKQFVASSDKVEVNGETVYSIIDGLGTFKKGGIQILEKQGIKDVKPGQWYNQQAWLNAFKEIASKLGDNTLFVIGMKIPENAQFPPDVNTVHKALAIIDVAYHMNHRNGEIGHYQYEPVGERSGKMVCTNPYPDSFDKGIITFMIRKYNLNKTVAKVFIDESQPTRKNGGDSTTYLISW
jgi:hypothetical protein